MLGLVVDIETTGFRNYDRSTGYLSDSSEILEVGYIRMDTESDTIYNAGSLYFYKPYFEVVYSKEFLDNSLSAGSITKDLYDQVIAIPPNDAQKVHGITREFVEKYEKDFNKNLATLAALVQKTCIIGKNSNTFDVPYIFDFITKHSKGLLNFTAQFNKAGIKTKDGVLAYYSSDFPGFDMQISFAPKYRELMAASGNPVPANKKGTLSQYIDVLHAWEDVDKLYASLPKERETRAHGALYDACMTYIVYQYCRENDLL